MSSGCFLFTHPLLHNILPKFLGKWPTSLTAGDLNAHTETSLNSFMPLLNNFAWHYSTYACPRHWASVKMYADLQRETNVVTHITVLLVSLEG